MGDLRLCKTTNCRYKSEFATMPKLRIKRFYYRNDRIHAEIREVGGEFHGLNRTWHHNGQLAEELRYRHGHLHGTSRQWNEKGRLLGSFTMNHGTGRQYYWHQNGTLRLEINSLNGKFFGRNRTWLQDGTLVQEIYYISNVDVTRAAYAARLGKPRRLSPTTGRKSFPSTNTSPPILKGCGARCGSPEECIGTAS